MSELSLRRNFADEKHKDSLIPLFFHLNMARCVFVRQTTFIRQKRLAPVRGKDYSKVIIKKNTMKNTEKNLIKLKVPRWDRWDTRILEEKDQQKLIDLFTRSGAKTKSDFVRSQILRDDFKVVIVRKEQEDYYHKLRELTAQIHKIGVLYNQTVRSINSYHSLKIAQVLLNKLEAYSLEIKSLLEEAVKLTEEYRKQW